MTPPLLPAGVRCNGVGMLEDLLRKGTLAAGVLLAVTLIACGNDDRGRAVATGAPTPDAPGADATAPHPFVGMWVTADGHIRQELRADGRYDEARGDRESAYTGSYTVQGNHLEYVDDTGFTATGDVRDGVLYHEHLVLHRRR